MIFYALRPNDLEMAKLYTSYRGEQYFRLRHKHEFWYSRGFHDRLGNESVMPTRREAFLGYLSRHYEMSRFENVLDYGGDRGQMLADGPGIDALYMKCRMSLLNPMLLKLLMSGI